MPRTETVTVNASPMRILVALPTGAGPHPGIIVMCHIGGLDAFTADRCDRLAAEGFVAIAPDIFHHHAWKEDRNERRATLRDHLMLDDINAAIDYAVAAANADPKRLGILGHCLGGRTALLGAGGIAKLRALAMYYGGRTMASWGDVLPAPFDMIRNIKGPVAGFFGNLDTGPSPEDVNKIEAELKRHAIPTAFTRYDGAGHAFQDHTEPDRYHQPSADDAWMKTLSFFKMELGGA